MVTSEAQAILDFWFEELTPQDWWRKSDVLDQQIMERFGHLHWAASHGECAAWRDSGLGRLAEIIVLDQFSRNIYRDQPGAFATDAMALVLSQEAILGGFDQALDAEQKSFMYMPFMHSESKVVHEQALQLFAQPGLENNLDFERRHKAIIDRFGRYPHRNAILGRESTREELDFLQQPGSSF